MSIRKSLQQLQEGPWQLWHSFTIFRQPTNAITMAGVNIVCGVNSAAPMKAIISLRAVDQENGHAKFANHCNSCRGVPGSRGTCLRFYGSPNMPNSVPVWRGGLLWRVCCTDEVHGCLLGGKLIKKQCKTRKSLPQLQEGP
jgi:hypothetical protein